MSRVYLGIKFARGIMTPALRYEKKMIFESLRLGEVRSWVYAHPDAFQVAYPPRQVNNIYFDTVDRFFMAKHIDGVGNRAKFRFRWYGESWQIPEGQLEIKKKMGHVGYKITHPVRRAINLPQLKWQEIMELLKSESSNEFSSLLDNLTPALINQYQREYYESADRKIRVTLDYDIRAFSQTFGLSPNLTFPQLSVDDVIIEMKVAQEDHQRMADSLAEFPLRCLQNSKYLNGMEYMV